MASKEPTTKKMAKEETAPIRKGKTAGKAAAVKKAPKKKAAPRKKQARSEASVVAPQKLKVSPEIKKTRVAAEPREQSIKKERYFEGIGRRKTAVARVRLFTKGDREFLVNAKPLTAYFPLFFLQEVAAAALKKMKVQDKFRIVVHTRGGGIHAQAEAIRHGSARALVAFNLEFRKRLKRAGYLRRDSREVERKKPGLKKARRAPQWAKR